MVSLVNACTFPTTTCGPLSSHAQIGPILYVIRLNLGAQGPANNLR